MARETAFYAFAASHEQWGVIDLLRSRELEQTAWDHWDYGAPDTEQTDITEMGDPQSLGLQNRNTIRTTLLSLTVIMERLPDALLRNGVSPYAFTSFTFFSGIVIPVLMTCKHLVCCQYFQFQSWHIIIFIRIKDNGISIFADPKTRMTKPFYFYFPHVFFLPSVISRNN